MQSTACEVLHSTIYGVQLLVTREESRQNHHKCSDPPYYFRLPVTEATHKQLRAGNVSTQSLPVSVHSINQNHSFRVFYGWPLLEYSLSSGVRFAYSCRLNKYGIVPARCSRRTLCIIKACVQSSQDSLYTHREFMCRASTIYCGKERDR